MCLSPFAFSSLVPALACSPVHRLCCMRMLVLVWVIALAGDHRYRLLLWLWLDWHNKHTSLSESNHIKADLDSVSVKDKPETIRIELNCLQVIFYPATSLHARTSWSNTKSHRPGAGEEILISNELDKYLHSYWKVFVSKESATLDSLRKQELWHKVTCVPPFSVRIQE